MKERPILFSGAMVSAILGGRKTMTRRVMKPQPDGELRPLGEWSAGLARACHDHAPDPKRLSDHAERLRGKIFPFTTASGGLMSPTCPYGVPGERLWVRESGWERPYRTPRDMREGADTWPPYEYDVAPVFCWEDGDMKRYGWKRRPSIHMPRWASRITLEITEVRVQRLQEITTNDAIAEGIGLGMYSCDGAARVADTMRCPPSVHLDWIALWDSINAKRAPWSSNPWVWAITFMRIEP